MDKLFCAAGREEAERPRGEGEREGKKAKKLRRSLLKQRAKPSGEARIDFDFADDGVSTREAEARDGGEDCKSNACAAAAASQPV